MNHTQLARICQESYQHSTFNIGECEAIIKYYHNVQVVAFRGTETGALFEGAGWMDVARDLSVIPWYDKDTGWVHSGFLDGGKRAAEFVADKLVKDLPVICAGHSLGGALALICAVKLQADGFVIKEWVGFGSPKLQLTRKTYEFIQTSYRYGADIVPTMPRIFGYRRNYPQCRVLPVFSRAPTWDDHGIDLYVKHVK